MLTPEEYEKQWRREKARERAARYRERHPERVKAARKRDYQKHREERLSAQNEYRRRMRDAERKLPDG